MRVSIPSALLLNALGSHSDLADVTRSSKGHPTAVTYFHTDLIRYLESSSSSRIPGSLGMQVFKDLPSCLPEDFTTSKA